MYIFLFKYGIDEVENFEVEDDAVRGRHKRIDGQISAAESGQ